MNIASDWFRIPGYGKPGGYLLSYLILIPINFNGATFDIPGVYLQSHSDIIGAQQAKVKETQL